VEDVDFITLQNFGIKKDGAVRFGEMERASSDKLNYEPWV